MSKSPDKPAEPEKLPMRMEDVIAGLADDLDALRAGRITIEDARARAGLAKQYIAGVRVVLAAQKFLSASAAPAIGADVS